MNKATFNPCKDCLGVCPEVCETCLYGLCKKPVDYKLTHYKWNNMINEVITEKDFYTWFKAYFNLNNSYERI